MDEMDGMALHRQLQSRYPALPVIMMTAHGSIPDAVEATKQGIFAFITKPVDKDELFDSLAKAIEIHGVNADEAAPKSNIVTRSGAMLHLLEQVKLLGPTQVNVLISGASGTGKELLAQAIHQHSHVSGGPFVAINCGAVPGELLESELFGHKKGAFTGAIEHRIGRLQAANGGTVFLDEVGNLPLHLQAKLLTILEQRKVTPLGTNKAIPFDVRIIAATNITKQDLNNESRFRQDLLFRLNTVEITLPPLRDRVIDIEPIANHYIAFYSRKYKKPEKAINADALNIIKHYAWPGNVRALRHAIERAIILSESEQLSPVDFQLSHDPLTSMAREPARTQTADTAELNLDKVEKSTIETALKKYLYNISHTAKALGLTRAALYRRMEKHGL